MRPRFCIEKCNSDFVMSNQRLEAVMAFVESIVVVLVCLGVINFIAAYMVAGAYGGSAENGYIWEGHYFLGDHNRYREVSPETYWFNYHYLFWSRTAFF